MSKKVIIGSRESRLAVIQSEMVRDYILSYNKDCEVELLTMKTTGDKILDRTLDKVGGKGLFVKELDKALLEKNEKTQEMYWYFRKGSKNWMNQNRLAVQVSDELFS